MSSLTGCACGPSSLAHAAKESASRSTSTTLRPLSTSAREIARPMPPAAPVITAFWSNVRSMNPFLSASSWYHSAAGSAAHLDARPFLQHLCNEGEIRIGAKPGVGDREHLAHRRAANHRNAHRLGLVDAEPDVLVGKAG